jgi:hypothetical protein
MFGAGDVRIENVLDARVIEPTDTVVTVTRACIRSSDLWPYKAIEPSDTGQIRKASVGWLRAGMVLTTLLAIAWSLLSAAPAWAADDTETLPV